MMAGRYNSDIKVWDNFVGIANVNGDNRNLDQRCLGLPPCTSPCLVLAKLPCVLFFHPMVGKL